MDLQSDFRTISETYVETLEVDVKAFFTLWYLKDATGKRDGGAITGSVEVIKRRGVGAGGDEGNNSSESMMRVNMDFPKVSASRVIKNMGLRAYQGQNRAGMAAELRRCWNRHKIDFQCRQRIHGIAREYTVSVTCTGIASLNSLVLTG